MKNYSGRVTTESDLKTGFKNLAPKIFQRKLDRTKNPIIIDVSPPNEFAKGSIPNAINISYQSDDFWDRIEAYKDETGVFVYSHTGRKSVRACTLLRNGGFSKHQIFNLDGGYRGWKKGRV